VDRDALFDAVDDVVYRLNPTRLYLLPDAAAAALEGPRRLSSPRCSLARPGTARSASWPRPPPALADALPAAVAVA
jgi:hypothetical protein